MKGCLVPGCESARLMDGLCRKHLGRPKGPRHSPQAGRARTATAQPRVAERKAIAKAQQTTARQAWSVLIADPTDDNRAVFVAACERAR